MTTILQQLVCNNTNTQPPKGQSIAIHRRLGTVLYYSNHNHTTNFEIFRRDGLDIECLWVKKGSWTLPIKENNENNNEMNNERKNESNENNDRKVCRLISTIAIESMNAFLIVLLINNDTSVLFLDALNCSFISVSELSSQLLPVCADFDQVRK